MTVLRPGSKAKIGDLEVMIGAVRLYGSPVVITYEAIWWKEGERKSAWVDDFEITSDHPREKHLELGFL